MKILLIGSCQNCPERETEDGKKLCLQADMFMVDKDLEKPFPEWCPLFDVEELLKGMTEAEILKTQEFRKGYRFL
jgi:hypothetical protein